MASYKKLDSKCNNLVYNLAHCCFRMITINSVHVDEKLSWEAHISEIVSKVAKVLAALRRLKPICPQSTLVTIYKSLILPHLEDCSAVWGCIGNGLSLKLEKLQNRAARIITGSGWDITEICTDSSCPQMGKPR